MLMSVGVKMTIKVFYGDRIEDLAAKLRETLKKERAAKGAFEFLKVAVANPNLGEGLATYWM